MNGSFHDSYDIRCGSLGGRTGPRPLLGRPRSLPCRRPPWRSDIRGTRDRIESPGPQSADAGRGTRIGIDLVLRRTHGYDLTADGSRLRDTLSGAETIIARATAPGDEAPLPIVKIAAGTRTMLALAEGRETIIGSPPTLRVRLVQCEDMLSIPQREAATGFRSRRPIEPGLAGREMRGVEVAPYAMPGGPDLWIVERCGDRIA